MQKFLGNSLPFIESASAKMTTNTDKLIWMMWYENQNPKGFPGQTLKDGLAYYTRKYGQMPNHVRLPLGTDLSTIQEEYPSLRAETDQMVLARHIQLTYDPSEKKPCNN